VERQRCRWNGKQLSYTRTYPDCYLSHQTLSFCGRTSSTSILGGVDLFDRFYSSYRPMIRGKKWWWPLLLIILNAAVVAGWLLHCPVFGAKALSHLEFRRQVTLTLIKVETIYDRRQLGGGPQGSLPVTVQYDGDGHMRVQCGQGRCRVCQIKNTDVMCLKCKARLHTDRGKDCFAQIHTSYVMFNDSCSRTSLYAYCRMGTCLCSRIGTCFVLNNVPVYEHVFFYFFSNSSAFYHIKAALKLSLNVIWMAFYHENYRNVLPGKLSKIHQ